MAPINFKIRADWNRPLKGCGPAKPDADAMQSTWFKSRKLCVPCVSYVIERRELYVIGPGLVGDQRNARFERVYRGIVPYEGIFAISPHAITPADRDLLQGKQGVVCFLNIRPKKRLNTQER